MAEEVFKRGAIPSPRHRLMAVPPFVPKEAAPTQFAVIPKQLSYWLNNVDGDCVSAEEAMAKAIFSLMSGLPELFVPDSEVGRWASKYNFLNGAMLPDVLDQMQKDGFTVGGVNYKDGPYTGVDWSNEAILQAAIAVGPVKVAISGDALPPGAGNASGWYALGGNYPNTDHCVPIIAYGPAEWLYQQLGVAMPSVLAGKRGYLVFSWDTIGFVDHPWVMGTVVEAYVRNPTTAGQGPPPPVCPPGQHLDPVTQKCVPNGPPPPTPAPQFVTIPQQEIVFTGWHRGHVPGGTYQVQTGTPQAPEAINWKAILALACALAPMFVPPQYLPLVQAACAAINPPKLIGSWDVQIAQVGKPCGGH